MDKQKALEDFETFLMIMDDQIESLCLEAKEHSIILQMNAQDLEKLEGLFDLLSQKKDKKDISALVVYFARHLGEIFRINHGGQWVLPLEDSSDIHFNLPVISGFNSKVPDLAFSPIHVMRSYSLRRKPGTLRRAFESSANPKAIDLDIELEDE